MKDFTLFLLLLLSLTIACTDKPKENVEEPTLTEKLVFETIKTTRKSSSCDQVGEACASADVSYVRAISGTEKLRQEINNYIEKSVMGMISEYDSIQPDASVESLLDKFITGFDEMRTEMEMGMGWDLKIENGVAYSGDDFITLSSNTYSYMGGAHGMATTQYAIFDTKTTKEIGLEDYIIVNENFLSYYDAAFRKQNDIPEGETYAKDGRFFEIGKQMPLAQEFGILGDKVVFFYNSYEIGPYASGTFELELTKEELKPYLQKGMK